MQFCGFIFCISLVTLNSHIAVVGAKTSMNLCGDKSPLDLGDSCVRASWATLVPAAFVFALCVFSIPVPTAVRRVFEPITRQFRPFLTLHEAEALDAQALAGDKVLEDEDSVAPAVHIPHVVPLWRTVVFVFVGIVETLWWLTIGSYLLYDDVQNWWRGTRALIFAAAWLYTVIRPIARPTATPPYDVFVIYLLLFGAAIFELGGYWFDHSVYGIPSPSWFMLAAIWADLVATTMLLGVVLRMPLAIPSERVKKEDIVRRRCIFVFPVRAHA